MTAFTINEKFEFLADYIDMIATKSIKSAIIVGDGGLGKSYVVYRQLRLNGFVEAKDTPTIKSKPEVVRPSLSQVIFSELLNFGVKKYAPSLKGVVKQLQNTPRSTVAQSRPVVQKSYVVVKGFTTAKSLYRSLYENRNSILVLDDCDSSLKDKTAVSMLKAALDSDNRVVTYASEITSDLPKSFTFNGSVVFISNLKMKEIPESLVSRAATADVTMTRVEIVQRMRQIVSEGVFMADVGMSQKVEALDFIGANITNPLIRTINLRTLISVVTNLRCKPASWKRLSLSMMISA